MSKDKVPGVQYAIGNTQKKKQVNDIMNKVKKTVISEQSEANATHISGLLKTTKKKLFSLVEESTKKLFFFGGGGFPLKPFFLGGGGVPPKKNFFWGGAP